MNDPREVLTRSAPPPDLVIRYGSWPDHIIDVRLPHTEAPAPLVVLLHGGFWRAEYDRTHTWPMAAALAERGYVVCTPEFRRIGHEGGGWPGTFDDVAAAVDALLGQEAEDAEAPQGEAEAEGEPRRTGGLLIRAVGRDRVDLQRAVVIGHSAGGHLALWSAARHRLPKGSPGFREEPLPIRGVVALAAVCDLGAGSALGLDDGAVDELLGGSPEERGERYDAADPSRLVPYDLPVVLVHGALDEQVPVGQSRGFAAAAGGLVELRELPATEHFGVIDPLSPAWPHVLAAVAEACDRSPSARR
ncbi:alpha/beta hydrolase family protein [Rhizohabitans arisaemae]|uniref:alpha/beta hydrolase family protein n=1 Tax=Rhizohabitans arisaemae TaxID=2720610 RepID=UPI0024B04FF0|nr:alpha/beta fold hydrolase [Rhizohabitans arisaemae]